MRLWTLSPRYLDVKGLLALWREGLLAQKVLAGETKGYTRHPQLLRFRESPDSLALIGAYLGEVVQEAQSRGYRFQAEKILSPGSWGKVVPVTAGQVDYERGWLLGKLRIRDPERGRVLEAVKAPELNGIFRVVPGAVEAWEKT